MKMITPGKLRIKEAIGVEGRDDTAAVKRAAECLVIETACGKKTANEINGCEQIAVFKDGVTL